MRLRKLEGGIYFVSEAQLIEMINTDCDDGDELILELYDRVTHYVSTDPSFECRMCRQRVPPAEVVFIVVLPVLHRSSWTTHICASCSMRNELPKYLEDAVRELFPLRPSPTVH